MSAAALVLGILLYGRDEVQGTVVAASMYGVLIIVLLLLRRAQMAKSVKASASNGVSARPLDSVCRKIAHEYGLSPRETKVFQLLAQGRSRTYIQSELFLSDGTVKTHTRHIYRKLGVHSKQDLISLIQSRY